MTLLQGGVDTSFIALWLGHESPATTKIYLDANLALKEQILGKMESWNGTKTGRYRPEDSILKFLKEL
jgi:integrase